MHRDIPENGTAVSARGEAVKARLKWFNGPKGFGFVVPENGTLDAFLHVTTLKRAGIDAIGEGACFLCHIEHGQKGAQVREVIAMLDAGIAPEPLVHASTPSRSDNDPTYEVTGTIKLYNAEKGFGFIVADDGEKDIFFHKRCLRRHRIDVIEPGTFVSVIFMQTPKGREALEFEFLE